MLGALLYHLPREATKLAQLQKQRVLLAKVRNRVDCVLPIEPLIDSGCLRACHRRLLPLLILYAIAAFEWTLKNCVWGELSGLRGRRWQLHIHRILNFANMSLNI